MPDTQTSQPQGGKILGAIGAIVVLAALLFWGVGQSQTPEAKVISEGAKPTAQEYQAEAQQLEYEPARLGDYEAGIKLVFEAKVVHVIEETELGQQNAVARLIKEQTTNAETIKQEQVLLVFTESMNLPQNEELQVRARYIGTGQYESAIGSTEELPAFQVDYLETTG